MYYQTLLLYVRERRGEKKKKKKRVGVKSSASGVGTRESSFNGGVDSSAHSDAEPKNKPYRLLEEEEEEQTHARGGSVRTALHYSPSPSPSRECCEDHRSPHHVLAPSVRPSSRPPVLPSASPIPTNKTITNKSTLRRGMKPSGFYLSRLSTAPFFLC